MVVLFHARDWCDPVQGRAWLNWLVAPGPSLIDLFFIISGFVMVYTTSDRSSAAGFAIRRFTRIWPSYVVVTAVTLAVFSLFGGGAGETMPSGHPLLILLRAGAFIPQDADGDPPFYGFPPLHVGWTLTYEMYFYAVFAVCLLFGRAHLVVLCAVLGFLLIGVPFARGELPHFSVWHREQPGGIGMLSVASSPMIWDFLAGVGLALMHRSRIRFPDAQAAWMAIGFGAALAFWLQWDNWASTFGPRAGATWLPLLAAATIAEKTRRLQIPRWILWLGEISFSLYLVHPLVLGVIGGMVLRHHPFGVKLAGIPFALFLLACAIPVASFSHTWLECRASFWLRDRMIALVPHRARPGSVPASKL